MTETDDRVTKNICIIGAGIVGVSTAIWLQREGHHVTLLDKLGPAGGTSYGNGGVLASCACVPVTVPGLIKKAPAMVLDKRSPLFLKWSYLPQLLPWLIKYLRHANADDTRRIAAALHGIVGDSLADHQALARGTGAEKWIVPCDYLYLYKDRRAFEADKFDWSLRRSLGIGWEELEGEGVQAYDDSFTGNLEFAVKLGNHGRIADPGRYVKDLAAHVVASGGDLKIANVERFNSKNERITSVVTDKGELHFDEFVITTGAWSGPFAKQLGITIPLESERGYHVELWNPSFMPKSPVMHTSGKFVITPMEGRLRLAGIVEFGGLVAGPSKAPYNLLLENIKKALPDLTWKEMTHWMGHRPAPSDSIPVIGPSPCFKNGWMGFGHHHIGLTGGPKTGQLLASMISNTRLNLNLASYAPVRFHTNH